MQGVEDGPDRQWNGQKDICEPQVASIVFEETFEVGAKSIKHDAAHCEEKNGQDGETYPLQT